MGTTHPPTIRSNVTVTTNLTLAIQAPRDTDIPDLGYHYDPLDYLAHNFSITNAVITITNGIVIAPLDGTGIWMQKGSAIQSFGTPTNPNRFVRYFNVQERPVILGPGSTHDNIVSINPYHATGTGATGEFRFTHFTGNGGRGYPTDAHVYCYPPWDFSSFSMWDCRFAFGDISMSGSNIVTFANNLFESVSIAVFGGETTLTLYNNLFRGKELYFERYFSTNVWIIKDNAFDTAVYYDSIGSSDPDASNNAYTNWLYRN